ncbi:EcoAI/FtnUII family type I restriction enzme subunit R [Pseudoalteromonas luteoviolacea]|uniref:EcoAI/FtnUII family type I restriction enzme subunit R n=1 Tax=Pseudoalteromonas luteoviolacea TaxID=43657 RepID=UPI001152FB45|nr:DEAD/DEAH box helicase family protein [Pseudoalteromonas luteoviolacea]TQF71895.1 DEAD/DEAH box helicase [Pseudoalteromonas luteoviolacea]
MDKKKLTERDICTKFILPAVKKAGWDIHSQIREEVSLTAGRIVVRGQMGARTKGKRADFVLYHKPNQPLAIIEAKKNTLPIAAGMQQGLSYSDILEVPFVFSSNGDGFVFHDKTGLYPQKEQELTLEEFPSHEELWAKYQEWKGYKPQELAAITQDYYEDGSGKSPRYYQMHAINKTVEAIAKGQDRALLVMATGTGKTYTAFQIIWRLWKAGIKKRILFLADRNILVDQTKTNDFKPFGSAMTKVTGRKVDTSYEIFLSLYQAITGPEEHQKAYKQFSPDFFDLIVIDECHRGSASEDSAWREILDYFGCASHVGLTATPKETEDVSNSTYFGEPVYTYSLKQGIDDGFLAPYKVVRVDLDKDLQGWRPTKNQYDKNGELIEDRIYNQQDFDRTLVIEERTQLVAKIVSDHLKATDPMAKTIVFCQDIDHANRMRQALVNENPEQVAKNRKYVMKITGDDAEGKAELDNFIDPESPYPVIATTSELMSTGVDAKTCKLVVLDQRIQSMTKFKQVIGRGTRIDEEYGKLWFTILDFKKATDRFADPDFDGEAEVIFKPNGGDSTVPPEDDPSGTDTTDDPTGGFDDPLEPLSGEDDDEPYKTGGDDPFTGGSGTDGVNEPRIKYVVKGITVSVLAERVQYIGADGKLITESVKDYTVKTVKQEYATLNDFIRKWNSAEQKQAVIQELQEQGVIWEALEQEVGSEYGAFDLICHVVYGQPPLTRKERAENVRKRDVFTKYGEQARKVLDALLDKYADKDIGTIEEVAVLKHAPFDQLGRPIELIREFGGKPKYQEAVQELEQLLYDDASNN